MKLSMHLYQRRRILMKVIIHLLKKNNTNESDYAPLLRKKNIYVIMHLLKKVIVHLYKEEEYL